MADAIKEKIVAQGDRVRQLKTSGAVKEEIIAEVNVLLQLKKDYKEATGEDYAAPSKPAEKKAKKGAEPQGEGAKPEGPSKKSLKKAAKQAEKGAKKAEKEAKKAEKEAKQAEKDTRGKTKQQPPDGADSPPPPPPTAGGAQGAGAGNRTAGTGGAKGGMKRPLSDPPLLYCEGRGPGALKCLAASFLYSVKVEVAQENPAGGMNFAVGCVLLAGGSLIFGPNAICRYFSYKDGGGGGVSADPLAVEQWVEWEAAVLAPAERALARAKERRKALPEGVLEALTLLEGHLGAVGSEGWMVKGTSPSLADVVVGATTLAAMGLLTVEEAACFPKASSYVERISETLAFKEALSMEGEFTQKVPEAMDSGAILGTLRRLFDDALFRAWPTAGTVGVTNAALQKCSNYKNGDFQCNVAMSLFKALKGTPGAPSNPLLVASGIVAAVPPSPLIDTVSVAGGFINIRLRQDFIIEKINSIIRDGPAPPKVKKQTVAVDFSSPNIAKEMHVGHLRSTILGDTVCKVLEFCGHEVHRLNHVGDWGTQFGMLINYLKEAYPNFLSEPPNITDLTKFYKAAKARFDESDEFKDRSRQTVVDLQSGDPACREVWLLLCDISRREFQKVYDRLGVHLSECGESFYNEQIPATIEDLERADLATMDDGATVVMMEHFTYPLIVRKRDGGYGYDSTDMTAIKYRLETLKCDTIIYITDAGQAGHFHMCFDAARACGWVSKDHRLEHIGFGVVLGEDGKKFKTRSGETVRLVDLLDEGVRRMKAAILERVEAGKITTSPEAVDSSAAEMGYGAVKYFDLRNHPTTPYVFSYDRMLDTRGNTAVYLQFAHARLQSILRKAEEEKGVDLNALKASGTVCVVHETERALAFELLLFTDVIETLVEDLCPNRMCDYLYTLSTKFTDFVTQCRVLDSPEQGGRLLLCEATGVTMRMCFKLLGMNALDRL